MTGNDVMSWGRANTAMLLATNRYRWRLTEMLEGIGDDGSVTDGELLAATYLKGVYDMGLLYAAVVIGEDDNPIAKHIEKIDMSVESYLASGGESKEQKEV